MTSWLLAGLAGSILLPYPDVRITKANYERIRGAMTQRQVEAILGGPAGDYQTGPTCSCLRGIVSFTPEDASLTELKWQGDEAEISVWVDPKGRTRCFSYECMIPQRVGTAGKLLWWYEHWQQSLWQRFVYLAYRFRVLGD